MTRKRVTDSAEGVSDAPEAVSPKVRVRVAVPGWRGGHDDADDLEAASHWDSRAWTRQSG